MFRKFLSYFIPLNIHSQKSGLSKALEITWNNGELVLDSKNTNYSYGSLQRILRRGLLDIGFDTIKEMSNILVLGVAGGSVIKTLVDEVKYKGKITGVEIDPQIILIANQYFQLDKIDNLQIVIDDAFEFVLKTKEKYDLVIIDIFQDTSMPQFLFESFFSNRVGFLLNENGFILFNTMTLTDDHNQRNIKYLSELDRELFSVKVLPRIENHNELIILKRIS